MDIWFKKLGFYNNPFSIKPAAFGDELYGYNLQDILNKVDSGEVIFIEGVYGQGKTTILKRIIREFGGKKKVVYYSCNRKEGDLDLDKLLRGGKGFFGRLFGTKSKGMILLLDESQEINEKDGENLANYHNEFFKSIVLVSHGFNSDNLSENLKKLVNSNVIRLGDVSPADAVNIIRKRIGNLDIIDDDIVAQIFSKSDNNPRRLLKNCEQVCKYAFDRGYDKVTKEHVDAILK